MSSYFVNSLFSKYKSGDSLRPNYYECGFAQDLAGSRPTVVYGPGSGATFQHAPQIQDFYHHSASTLPSNPYQQSPCAVTCHGESGNFYGYDALQRQTLFGAQDGDLVQYSDCKLGGAPGLSSEDAEGTDQSPSPTQLFPWMRPQGVTVCVGSRLQKGDVNLIKTFRLQQMGHICLSCWKEARPADLQPLPDSGAGEGVPVQPVPDPKAPHRGVARAGTDGAAGEDLVPES
ncbi:homeobox protein Hox-B8a isoform X3 [Syngnathoides biaculeatus]|uniref:homeobox protein Hox-B8a isoform X3 n=1 Tax=Syngnathoides biaculeatus TaxID=300417 RepID=UPI002ADE3541|nr:homeobox protein Hox-B8a isoform X3 [Syngnathoides biaculeatus]